MQKYIYLTFFLQLFFFLSKVDIITRGLNAKFVTFLAKSTIKILHKRFLFSHSFHSSWLQGGGARPLTPHRPLFWKHVPLLNLLLQLCATHFTANVAWCGVEWWQRCRSWIILCCRFFFFFSFLSTFERRSLTEGTRRDAFRVATWHVKQYHISHLSAGNSKIFCSFFFFLFLKFIIKTNECALATGREVTGLGHL